MESQDKVIDYGQEAKKLQERAELPPFWKPTVGKHAIKLCSEMKQFTFIDDEEKEQTRIAVQIEEAGKKFVWAMGIGVTKASAYGQLIEVATNNNNKLTDKEITVVVKSDGKKNDYTIV
jgi:hypothetical protein